MAERMECEDSSFGVDGGTCTLEELPLDLIKTIFAFLFLDEFDVLSLVSKRTNEAVSWANQLTMQPSRVQEREGVSIEAHVSEAGMRKLLQRYKSLNILHLHGLAAVGDNLFSILNESPSAQTLHRISLHGCCLSYWCPTSLQLQQLTHITIMGGSIRVAFGSLITSSRCLKSLAIGHCSSLRDDNVADVTNRLRDTLESLSLSQCLRVRKPILQFDHLKSLSLMGCFSLCDLPDFHCPALTTLCLSFCFRLEGELIQRIIDSLPEIKYLALVKCPRLNGLHIVSDTLTTLNVSLSNNLHTLSLSCNCLETLEATSCTSLRSFHLDSKCIQELNLTMLPLQNAQVAAPSLTHLKLCGCESLVEADIVCPKLDFVDICGTPLPPNMFRDKVKFLKHGVTSAPDPPFIM